MKKIICILLAFLPLFAVAKDDKKNDNTNPKYLTGAVTMTDGKITFDKEVRIPSLSKEEIYTKLLEWAHQRFQPEDKLYSKVVYENKEEGQISATAEEYMVFSSSALSLDRTRIYYQFSMFADNGKFKMIMNRIRYWYDENRNGGEKYKAEEWITDDMALNKKKTKLAPISGKFRRETIDLKDNLFQSAIDAISRQAVVASDQKNEAAPKATETTNKQVIEVQAQPVIVPATPVQSDNSSNKELKEININQLPANLNEIATSGRMTITVGEEEVDVKAETWGGFGKLLNKNVTYTLIDKSRMAVSLLMEHTDTYTISFYQAGQTKPAVVIDCKKSMKQELTSEELKSLNQQINTEKQYIMYIGSVSRCMMR